MQGLECVSRQTSAKTTLLLSKTPTTTFGAELFLELGRSRVRPSAPRTNAGPSSRKTRKIPARVLVVDDVPDVAEVLALLLSRAGYQVTAAGSAFEALDLARLRAFDVVISDIGMPRMNGYQLAGALRALPAYRHVPLIAFTGYTEYDDRGRTLRAGFSAHLTKPIDPAGLLDLINELLC